MSNVGLGKGGRHCAVNNCSNGDYGLRKWTKAVCTKHGCLQGGDDCNTSTTMCTWVAVETIDYFL